MAERLLRMLQVSTADILGGAEKVAWDLFQAYGTRGYGSWLAVGRKHSDDPDVLLVPNDDCRSQWARIWLAIGNVLSPLVGRIRGVGRLRHWLHLMGQVQATIGDSAGLRGLRFPRHMAPFRLAAVALLHGVAAEELSPSELDYRALDYEMIITVRAVKPDRSEG